MRPFHLAFPVTNIAATRHFYVEMLGCRVGREAESWIDFDFGGHQISAHLVARIVGSATSEVDGDAVPARHFGMILTMSEWQALAARLRSLGTRFIIEPHVRFKGEVGEQSTMFLRDPSGNALEFKAFADDASIFAR